MSEGLFNSLDHPVWVEGADGLVELPRAPRFTILLDAVSAPLTLLVPGTEHTVELSCSTSSPRATLFSPVAMPDVLYLVEEHVALALPYRTDLVCPATISHDTSSSRLVLRTLRRPRAAAGSVRNLGDEISDQEIAAALDLEP